MQLSPPLEKQPYEEFPVSVDFASEMTALSDTIDTFPVTARNLASGLDATSEICEGNPTRSGHRITQQVKAGASGTNYRLEFRIVGTINGGANKFEADIDIQVKEV